MALRMEQEIQSYRQKEQKKLEAGMAAREQTLAQVEAQSQQKEVEEGFEAALQFQADEFQSQAEALKALLYNSQSQLATAQSHLAMSQSQLATSQGQLAASQADLALILSQLQRQNISTNIPHEEASSSFKGESIAELEKFENDSARGASDLVDIDAGVVAVDVADNEVSNSEEFEGQHDLECDVITRECVSTGPVQVS